VTLFATGTADLGGLICAFGGTVTFFLAVTAGSSEWAFDTLVVAIGLVVTAEVSTKNARMSTNFSIHC
jgi:hypothetical protein